MGEPDAALEALRKSVKLDSKEPRYRARLGAVLVEKGHFEEAEQQLRQAVLLNDRYAEGLYYLARALAGRNNLSEAIDDMKKAIELEPSGEYFYHLGLIYERGQQVQDAIDALTRSIDKLPRNADAPLESVTVTDTGVLGEMVPVTVIGVPTGPVMGVRLAENDVPAKVADSVEPGTIVCGRTPL